MNEKCFVGSQEAIVMKADSDKDCGIEKNSTNSTIKWLY
jgi:hypothetical protein